MKIPGLRWWIVFLVFVAAVINYVDRQTLSALAPSIQADLRMDDRAYAHVVNLFLVAYTISYLVSGRLVDRLGTRTGTAIFVFWWSLANAAAAFAQGTRSMGTSRFLLGLGEAGIWPAASKIVSEWFPARERALAIGLYTMGATIGAMLVPQLIIPLAGYDFSGNLPTMHILFGSMEGWRIAFLLCGIIGLLWIVPWLVAARNPSENNLLTAKEADLILSGEAADPAAGTSPWPWKKILRFPPLWFFLIARLLTDPVWYFYQFWFAKFLYTEHDIPQNDLTITWVLYAAASAGSLVGGWISGRLIAGGMHPAKARMRVMLICSCIMPVSPAIAFTTGTPFTLVLAACAVFSAVSWLTNISTLIVDTVPKHSLGTVFSTIAAGSTIGSVVMNVALVHMLSELPPPDHSANTGLERMLEELHAVVHGGYQPWFVIMAFLHPLAWLLLRWAGMHRHNSSALQS